MFKKITILLGTFVLSLLALISITTAANCTPTEQELARGIDYSSCDDGFTFPSFNRYSNYPLVDGTTRNELDFFRIGKVGSDEPYTHNVGVEPGDKVEFYGIMHNDCDPTLNDEGRGQCVAKKVRAAIDQFRFNSEANNFVTGGLVPDGIEIVTMSVSADNTKPKTVRDTASFTNTSNKRVRAEYVSGSAHYLNATSRVTNFLAPNELFSNNGAYITSVNNSAGTFDDGTFFGSQDYIIYLKFQANIVEDRGGEGACVDLDLVEVQRDDERRIAKYRVDVNPETLLGQVTVAKQSGPGTIAATIDGRSFTVTGYDETTVIVAFVPGEEGKCKDTVRFNNLPDDECKDLRIQPRSFVPQPGRQTFRAVTDPENFNNVQWRLTGGNNRNVEVIVANGKEVSFNNLQATHVIEAFGVGEGPACKDKIESKFGPGEFCTGAILSPTVYPETGELQRFRFTPIPADYKGKFIWESNTGVFADGEQVGNPLITDKRNVSYRGGKPGGTITVRAQDPQFAGICNARARADKVPPEPNENLKKAVNKTLANPGDKLTYTIIYTKDSFFAGDGTVTIFDTIGKEGVIRGDRGGVIKPTGNMRVDGLRVCSSQSETNCYIGSILKPEGITLQKVTTIQPIVITYEAVVDTKVSQEVCEKIRPGDGGTCGEKFLNEAFDTQGHLAKATVTVLCPAFRSFGYGDILLEEAFKTGIDTASCGDKPNTPGIVVAPRPTDNQNRIVSTGANDATLPQHGLCKEQENANPILSRISSQFCELDSRFNEQIYSLKGVKQNADRLCLNTERRNATISSGNITDIKRILNSNNRNENIGCFETLTINGPITIDDQVTFIARNTTINGDITYDETQTEDLPGFVLATEKLTINKAKLLNGVYIGLPDANGKIYAATINDDPNRSGQPFNVLGSMLLNFEITNSDINVVYDIIRVQSFSILSDIIQYLQESGV